MLFVALAAAALAVEPVEAVEPVDLSGPVLAAELSLIGAPDSCAAAAPGIRLGYRFDTPFAPKRPWLGGLVFRPEVGVRGMPCQGGSLLTGVRLGLRGGPIELGAYTHLGVAGMFDPSPNAPARYPNGGLGGYVAVVTVPVEVTLHYGLMAGYLGQGWLDLGVTVGWRF